MTPIRLLFCVSLLTVAATSAGAAPAYVPSTVNLRTAAGTGNEIVTKIPGGSLVDVGTCTEGWCEVEWQGKKGFAIATALDRSGRVPSARAPSRMVTGSVHRGPVAVGPRYVEVTPPMVYGPPVVYGPPPYAYPYYYRPYWGYRRWRYW